MLKKVLENIHIWISLTGATILAIAEISTPYSSDARQYFITLLLYEYRYYFLLIICIIALHRHLIRLTMDTVKLYVFNVFYAAYSAARLSFVSASFSVAAMLIISLSTAIFVTAVAQLSYVIYRDYNLISIDVIRQSMLKQANDSLATERLSEARITYLKVLEWFPNDRRNSDVEDRIDEIDDRISESERLYKLSVELSDLNRHGTAFLILEASTQMWPENARAKSSFDSLVGMINRDTTKYARIAQACKDGEMATLSTIVGGSENVLVLDQNAGFSNAPSGDDSAGLDFAGICESRPNVIIFDRVAAADWEDSK